MIGEVQQQEEWCCVWFFGGGPESAPPSAFFFQYLVWIRRGGSLQLYGRQEVAAPGEVGRHRRKVRVGAHVHHQVHADDDVEQEVTVEQPVACKVEAKQTC